MGLLDLWDACRPRVYALDLWLRRLVCGVRGHDYRCNPWLRHRICSRCERWEDAE